MSSVKEAQKKIVKDLKKWQKIEKQSVTSAGAIADRADNTLLKTVMRIIEADSQRHFEVQQLIIDSLTESAMALTPEGLADVWDQVEKHVAMEREMIDEVRDSLNVVTGKQLAIQEYLLRYLLADERKHEQLLSELDSIKRGMHPYGT